jgi:hypothetical protein
MLIAPQREVESFAKPGRGTRLGDVRRGKEKGRGRYGTGRRGKETGGASEKYLGLHCLYLCLAME